GSQDRRLPASTGPVPRHGQPVPDLLHADHRLGHVLDPMLHPPAGPRALQPAAPRLATSLAPARGDTRLHAQPLAHVLPDPALGTHVAPRPEAAQVRRPAGPVPARGVTGGIARLPVAPAPFPLPRGFFLRSEPFAAPFQEAHARLQDAVRDRPELR